MKALLTAKIYWEFYTLFFYETYIVFQRHLENSLEEKQVPLDFTILYST